MSRIDRNQLINQLMWNEGGNGLGICTIGSAMAWAMAKPVSPEEDMPSVVAISGPAEKYTDEELAQLVVFSQERTTRYDTMFNQRMGCNLILIDKVTRFDGSVVWLRKRLTWNQGPMYSETLQQALEVFNKD